VRTVAARARNRQSTYTVGDGGFDPQYALHAKLPPSTDGGRNRRAGTKTMPSSTRVVSLCG
jgi:hypothetical protein